MSDYNLFFEDPIKVFDSLLNRDEDKKPMPVGNVLTRNLMRTDIVDKGEKYLLISEVPSFDKKDISIELNKGYLTISAETKEEIKNEEYMFRERHIGKISRSFYVGEEIKEKDISAKMEKGLLQISIKKPLKKPEEKTNIVIS